METYEYFRVFYPNISDNFLNPICFTQKYYYTIPGSHGDGHPTNTETPLVVWGAGIRKPSPASPEDYGDDEAMFVDQHEHHPPTPSGWGLGDFERVDVNQGDIAPLMVMGS